MNHDAHSGAAADCGPETDSRFGAPKAVAIGPEAVVTDPRDPAAARELASIRAEHAAFAERVLTVITAAGRELYSPEIAPLVGLPVELSTLARIRKACALLERRGALVSRFVPGPECVPPSQLARRYYRVSAAGGAA